MTIMMVINTFYNLLFLQFIQLCLSSFMLYKILKSDFNEQKKEKYKLN